MTEPFADVAAHILGRANVNLSDILDDVQRFVRRFVQLSEEQLVAIALWVAMTYCIGAFEVVGYLHIHSPEKRSGKTRLLDVLAVLVSRPMLAADMTPAVLFRVVDEMRPTVLFDEVDVIFRGKGERADELRPLLHAGFKRGGAVWRVEMNGRAGKPRSFEVFGPKALAGIGRLPDTIEDRAIPIAMARQLRGAPVERFRTRGKLEETAALRAALDRWSESELLHLASAYPDLPEELHDRAQDIWEPLLAIADLAGGRWPSRARAAARELHTGAEDVDTSEGALLLRHVRDAFDAQPGRASLSTEDLLGFLVDADAGPWGRWWSIDSKASRQSAASGLARKLRPFGISSLPIRTDRGTRRGYRREDFRDAWERYLPLPGATPATGATAQAAATSSVAAVAEVAPPPQGGA